MPRIRDGRTGCSSESEANIAERERKIKGEKMLAGYHGMDQKEENGSAGRYVLPALSLEALPDTVKEILKGAVVIAVGIIGAVAVLRTGGSIIGVSGFILRGAFRSVAGH